MVGPNDERFVLIIDTLPLRHLNLVSILSHLDRPIGCGQLRLTLRTPDEIDQRIDPDKNCEMLIYNVGDASICDRETSQRVKALTTLAPDVPLVIVSDSESHGEIISALNVGAQGFLYAGTSVEIALQAFSFILNRSPHLSAMQPKRTYPEQSLRPIDCNPVSSCLTDTGDGGAGDLEDASADKSNLTARQKAVLELLSRGDSNKAIARRLGMREGTVKVHVRQIMRKFGVSNRTQVVVVCSNAAASQNLATPELKSPSRAASLPPRPQVRAERPF
jgi:DNA-binding NarL/FixJ family response regulator